MAVIAGPYHERRMVAMSATSVIELRPLSPALGVEVVGVDLSETPPPAVAKALDAALDEYAVLLFRGQTLSEDQQLRIADIFGGPSDRSRPEHKRAEDNPYAAKIGLVSNIRKDGKPIGSLPDGELWFHHDGAFVDEPYRATVLYAVEVTEEGGHTRFADMCGAYDALSEEMKQRLKGLRCLNIFDHRSTANRADADQDLSDVRHARHPAAVRHPHTGRAALYVNPLQSARFEGMEAAESEALLEELFRYTENEALIYEHVWRKGDLVIWDNWATSHARTDFPADQTRLLRRSIVRGRALEEAP